MMNRNSFVQTRQLEKQNIGILLFSEEGHLGLYEDKHLILNVYPLAYYGYVVDQEVSQKACTYVVDQLYLPQPSGQLQEQR